MFNVHVYKYIAETINSRSQSLFLQCSVKVGICTDSDLFLTLLKYTIVDPKAYDFPLNYILIITISFLLSHLSKKLCKDTQGYVCVCILGYISSDLIENRTVRPTPFPLPGHFLFKTIRVFSPSDHSRAGCSFHCCHHHYPLITMANQVARQPTPIIKVTQINSPAMSECIHSTYTDMA